MYLTFLFGFKKEFLGNMYLHIRYYTLKKTSWIRILCTCHLYPMIYDEIPNIVYILQHPQERV